MSRIRFIVAAVFLCSCTVTTLTVQMPPPNHIDQVPVTSQSSVVIEKTIEVPSIKIVKEPTLISKPEVVTRNICQKYQLPKQPNLDLPKNISDLLKNDQQKGIEALLKHIKDLHQYNSDINRTYRDYSNTCKN